MHLNEGRSEPVFIFIILLYDEITYIKKANVNMQIDIYIINGSIFPEKKEYHVTAIFDTLEHPKEKESD